MARLTSWPALASLIRVPAQPISMSSGCGPMASTRSVFEAVFRFNASMLSALDLGGLKDAGGGGALVEEQVHGAHVGREAQFRVLLAVGRVLVVLGQQAD